MRRVAITGLGAICALGRTTEEFARALAEGRSGIARIESTDVSQLRFQNGAEVKGYSHGPYFEDRRARSHRRCGRRVDSRAARIGRDRHRFLRGRPEHRRHRISGGL